MENNSGRGVANGTSKIVGLAHFSSSLEISAAFTKSLVFSAFISASKSRIFYPCSRSLGFVINIIAESLDQKIARVA